MGLLDRFRTIVGARAESDATQRADPDDLFGMSTAYVTMLADLSYDSMGVAALCFSHVASSDFRAMVEEVDAIMAAGEDETGTIAEINADGHGYEWVVLEDDDPEDLVTSVHFAAETFIDRDFGSRLLAALFAFERDGDPAYWVYSFRRGAYYPFAPKGTSDRDHARELKLRSVLDGELELEDDERYWYPLWPSRPGGHPWD